MDRAIPDSTSILAIGEAATLAVTAPADAARTSTPEAIAASAATALA